MRRPDDVRDSIGDGHFGHLNRRFEGVRAIVQTREDVAVDIDHHDLKSRYSNRVRRTIE